MEVDADVVVFAAGRLLIVFNLRTTEGMLMSGIKGWKWSDYQNVCVKSV